MFVLDDGVGIASDPAELETCQSMVKAESAVQGKRQAGLTVACGLSLASHNSRFIAAHARAHSSVVSVTGDCCARFPRSFAAVVAADVAMLDACANGRSRGSGSDAFNSGGAGGLLPVCKSTSYHLDVCSHGPTGRKRVKGGVSGLAEDLRPVSEVEAGVNFRPAGVVRVHVAGSIPRRQPGTGTRRVREGAVTPSLHRRFLVSDSCHLDADWTSGNRWAGRRCVEPHVRGFGC